jgi:hypothetical protein
VSIDPLIAWTPVPVSQNPPSSPSLAHHGAQEDCAAKGLAADPLELYATKRHAQPRHWLQKTFTDDIYDKPGEAACPDPDAELQRGGTVP